MCKAILDHTYYNRVNALSIASPMAVREDLDRLASNGGGVWFWEPSLSHRTKQRCLDAMVQQHMLSYYFCLELMI